MFNQCKSLPSDVVHDLTIEVAIQLSIKNEVAIQLSIKNADLVRLYQNAFLR